MASNTFACPSFFAPHLIATKPSGFTRLSSCKSDFRKILEGSSQYFAKGVPVVERWCSS